MPTVRMVNPALARTCNICLNKPTEVARVNHALMAELPLDVIAGHLDCTVADLELHEAHGINAKKGSGRESMEALLKRLHFLDTVLRRMRENLEQRDPRSAIMAVREQSRVIEQIAKMVGIVKTGTEVNVSVETGPLPSIEEMATRLGRLDTPESAARRLAAARWIVTGSVEEAQKLLMFMGARISPEHETVEGEIVDDGGE